MASSKVETVVVDKFDGNLTSDLIGLLNSGLSPQAMNPYGKAFMASKFKSRGLEFLTTTYALTGSTPTATIIPVARFKGGISGDTIVGAIGVSIDGHIYLAKASDITAITPDLDAISQYAGLYEVDSVYGGGGLYVDPTTASGTTTTIVIGTDAQLVSGSHYGAWYITLSNLILGNEPTPVSASGITWVVSAPRPMVKFFGTLYVANAQNIVALNSSYASAIVGAGSGGGWLNPGLPSNFTITDAKVTPDGRYMMMVANNGNLNGFPVSLAQQLNVQPIDSVVLSWNGTDATFTTEQFFYGLNITAIAMSNLQTVLFAKDLNGVFLMDASGNELARIEDQGNSCYPPSPYSVDVVGKYVFFAMAVGEGINGYCFDVTTNALVPIFTIPAITNGGIPGGLILPTLHAQNLNGAVWTDFTRSKIYHFYESGVYTGTTQKNLAMHLQNYSDTVQGYYATQVQEFGRKVRPVKMRVYCLPTSGTVGFTLGLYDAQLNVYGSQTYQYAPGSDLTQAEGALTKIEIPLAMKPLSGFGAFIYPDSILGLKSNPFFVEKIEIDYIQVDNPPSN